MNSEFEKDVLAELAAQNVAIVRALTMLSKLYISYPGATREHIEELRESGLADLGKMTYLSIRPDEMASFTENAKQRYSNLISKIRI